MPSKLESIPLELRLKVLEYLIHPWESYKPTVPRYPQDVNRDVRETVWTYPMAALHLARASRVYAKSVMGAVIQVVKAAEVELRVKEYEAYCKGEEIKRVGTLFQFEDLIDRVSNQTSRETALEALRSQCSSGTEDSGATFFDSHPAQSEDETRLVQLQHCQVRIPSDCPPGEPYQVHIYGVPVWLQGGEIYRNKGGFIPLSILRLNGLPTAPPADPQSWVLAFEDSQRENRGKFRCAERALRRLREWILHRQSVFKAFAELADAWATGNWMNSDGHDAVTNMILRDMERRMRVSNLMAALP